MTKNFSAYLDVLRFGAALIVFLGHASTGYMTGGIFWQLAGYGDTCVMVFFVLSGFVIGYVADTKDVNWQLYASNRLARLWSVVLPALVLTFAVDLIGVSVAPKIYAGPWYFGDHLILRYIASMTMLHEVWHLYLVPGINGPFWSLTYEVIYYLVFGVLVFFKSNKRWLLAGAILVAAGPLITALFPIWGLGYLAYRLTKKISFSIWTNLALFVCGTALLLLAPTLRPATFDFRVMGDPMLPRFVDAIAIFANLIGAEGLLKTAPELRPRVRSFIASVAGMTFALYLLHRPLLQFFSYVGPSDSASVGRRVLVLGGTFALAYLATPWTEKFREILRNKLYKLMATKSKLEKADVAVPVALGHPLHQLDTVVGTFELTDAHRSEHTNVDVPLMRR